MRRSDFHYELPEALIAQQPLKQRGASRLLVLDGNTGELTDRQFSDLPGLLDARDLLVLNDTRVIPARLAGLKESGGRTECLIERVLAESRALAHIRASRAPRSGSLLQLEGGASARVIGRREDLFELEFDRPLLPYLEAHGHVPLPPYIRRADDPADRERYQTVYAREAGAVAAPTAGLHFDAGMLERLAALGVARAFVTLHVGAGTFQPVRVDDLDRHRMHAELVRVGADTCRAVAAAKARGGRVIAVGTTTVRALESAALGGELVPYTGETGLFIRPGFEFRVVDAMITNFHLPESTLLMLVCAFSGKEAVLAAYRHAVAQRYRFFSYGDAMFLTRSAGGRTVQEGQGR